MHVKWWLPVCAGVASLLTGCGDGSTASSTTAINLGSTAYATQPPTQSTLPQTTLPGVGDPAGATTYVIVAGDVPVNVAKRFGVTLDALNLANSDTAGYSAFFVGLTINIPAGGIVPAATTTLPGTVTVPTGTTTTLAGGSTGCTPGTHTIVEGDLPGTVAAQYDVTLAQLDAANVNTKGYTNFIVGVKIVIPCE